MKMKRNTYNHGFYLFFNKQSVSVFLLEFHSNEHSS